MYDLNVSQRQFSDEKEYIAKRANEFIEIYEKRPFDNDQGVQGIGAFALWLYVKELQPEWVIESGFWRGGSTWVIRQAVPEAKMIAMDPIFYLSPFMKEGAFEPSYYDSNWTALWTDFSCYEIPKEMDVNKTLLVFDDHHPKIHRLKQGVAKGFKHFIFDDNHPYNRTHRTFTMEINDGQGGDLESIVDRYDILPPLWSGNAQERLIPGLDVVGEDHLRASLENLDVYAWITYIKAKAQT